MDDVDGGIRPQESQKNPMMVLHLFTTFYHQFIQFILWQIAIENGPVEIVDLPIKNAW